MSDSFATPWTIACQAPLSMGFPRQEYWLGLQFLLQGSPNPGIELAASALEGRFFATEPLAKLGKRIEWVIFVYAIRRGNYFKPSY